MELDYKYIKRLRGSSIKDKFRQELNRRLRLVSDDCINLIERMLCKDPNNRIAMVEIFEHPWIQKYKNRYEKWGMAKKEESTSSDESEVDLEEEKNRIDNDLHQANLFNIIENDNETTGNYV